MGIAESSPGLMPIGRHQAQKGAILDQLCPHPMTLEASEACCHRLAGVLFPWDITRALELALLKTFCVPSISALLAHTGEFEQRPRKRYDDTGLMVAELLRHGLDSAPGAAVGDGRCPCPDLAGLGPARLRLGRDPSSSAASALLAWGWT